MQTFMPYPTFSQSLSCLDNRRLGKQRVEAKQILDTLCGKSKGWKNHPAVLMWKGHEVSLILYYNLALNIWQDRGFRNEKLKLITNIPKKLLRGNGLPHWMNNEQFHASHRSNLLRKDPTWYGQFGWKEPDNLPYIWPAQKLEKVLI